MGPFQSLEAVAIKGCQGEPGAAAVTKNPLADEMGDGIRYQHIILEQSLQPPDINFLTSLRALPPVSIPPAQMLSLSSAFKLLQYSL